MSETQHPRRGPGTVALAALASLALVLAACSSDGSDGSDGAASTTTAPASTTSLPDAPEGDVVVDPATGRRSCKPTTQEGPVAATPVAGSDQDLDLTSFDGTAIRIHWFPVEGSGPDDPAPTVLMGPGWSLGGDTSTEGSALFGAASISGLHDAGYSVLTWDPRGFGESGGAASVNDPELEGRDVQVLLDWVAEQPGVLLDQPTDARVGMVGFSYGGGIQLTVAAIDCRVDVIVPGLAWHSLQTSLYKANTVKSGWSEFLVGAAATGTVDPHVTEANDQGRTTGTLDQENYDWFLARGPGELVDQIDVPTLFVQGTVDTLFTLDESITNYLALRTRDVPTAQLWICSGHGTCLTEPGDANRFTEATFAWLARHLDGDESAEPVPALDLVDQDGVRWTGDDYPLAAGEPVVASGAGTLALTEASAAGPVTVPGDAGQVLDGLVVGITPARAEVALEVQVDPGTVDTLALGAPALTLRYTGTGGDTADERPTRVFAQLVDDQTGVVVGNQITPIAVTLDGQEHTTEVDLEVIAHHLSDGRTLTLQLVATTVAYSRPALGGEITFAAVDLSIPTTDAATRP